MNKKQIISRTGVFAVILLTILACAIGAKKEEIPQPPSGYIQPDEESANRVTQNFNQAMQEASGTAQFKFSVSNQEITSLVAKALAQRTDIPLKDPQIWFTAGKIYITGKVEGIGPSALPALIIAIPQVNENGRLEVTVDEAKMGTFNFPDGVIENITQTANDTLADLQLDIQITAIEVLEGEMLVAGKRIQP